MADANLVHYILWPILLLLLLLLCCLWFLFCRKQPDLKLGFLVRKNSYSSSKSESDETERKLIPNQEHRVDVIEKSGQVKKI